MPGTKKFFFLMLTPEMAKLSENNPAVRMELAKEPVVPVFISDIKELKPSEEDLMLVVIPQPIPDEDFEDWNNFLSKYLWKGTRAYIVDQVNFEKFIASDLFMKICKAIRDLRRMNAE